MNLETLFNGVAVVIDDEISESTANINRIVSQIETKSIPVLKYNSLPEDGIINHFKNISFLLLDWRLIDDSELKKALKDGGRIPDALRHDLDNRNIQFIKELNKNGFFPIFIFTNEDTSYIKNKLIDSEIMLKERPSNIFIKSKNDLKEKGALLNVINEWLQNNPSIYVLKTWEKEYQCSKTRMFNELQKYSPVWPKILWENYISDNTDPSLELGEFITNNLHTRMIPLKFSDDILKTSQGEIDQNELKLVIEGTTFLSNLSSNIAPGDIFRKSDNYYINIRAACDVIPARGDSPTSLDDVELYLIKGSRLSNTQAKKAYRKEYGNFFEIDSQSIVFPIDNGKIIDFRFRNLEIKKWSEVKNNRIGRLLPPYINRIQQRYSLYMQRQGLPRIPDRAILDGEN